MADASSVKPPPEAALPLKKIPVPVAIPVRRPPPKPAAPPVAAPAPPTAVAHPSLDKESIKPLRDDSDGVASVISGHEGVSGSGAGSIAGQLATVKRGARSENEKIQQLRGIFAAYDDNHDGVLTKLCVTVCVGCLHPLPCPMVALCCGCSELRNALMAIGIKPTQDVLLLYQFASVGSKGVDVAAVRCCRVACDALWG